MEKRNDPDGAGGDHSARAVAERAVEVVNTLATPYAGPAAVAEVLRRHGEPAPVEVSDEDVAGLRSVAVDITDLFEASEPGRWAVGLNELLRRWAGPPRLSCHGGVGWHLHVDSDDDASWTEWFAASTVFALAVLFADRGAGPGGPCSAPGCRRLFLHSWRGAPRRFCSTRCATRARVAAHRSRRQLP